jgi:predicted enzyme related to lactoylglutathione lyase
LVGVLRVEDTDAALVKIVDLGGSVLMAVEDTTYWRLEGMPSLNS